MTRTIIITGGSRGIGFGIATCFAKRGDRIVIADIDQAAGDQAATQLGQLGASEAYAIACNVTKRDDISRLVANVTDRGHTIDVLVNNAGICPFIDIMDLDEATWHRTMDINCTGAFLCTQIISQSMIDHHTPGRIIFITSLAATVTGPSQVDYAASKAGMTMTMAGFATRLGRHGITCNAVAPGMILTDLTRHHWEQPGPAAHIKERVPVGRIGTPIDIGHAAIFLAESTSSYVNGITIRVDGGHQAVCV